MQGFSFHLLLCNEIKIANKIILYQQIWIKYWNYLWFIIKLFWDVLCNAHIFYYSKNLLKNSKQTVMANRTMNSKLLISSNNKGFMAIGGIDVGSTKIAVNTIRQF